MVKKVIVCNEMRDFVCGKISPHLESLIYLVALEGSQFIDYSKIQELKDYVRSLESSELKSFLVDLINVWEENKSHRNDSNLLVYRDRQMVAIKLFLIRATLNH